jgi:hypothetical protein
LAGKRQLRKKASAGTVLELGEENNKMQNLAENTKYLEKKKEHEETLTAIRKSREELHKAECKLQDLDKNTLGKWDEIEEVRKQYCKAQKKITKLQVEKDIDYKNLVEEQKPDAIERGLKINKAIIEKLKELEELKEQYLKLQDEWKQYFGLEHTKTELIEDTIGPNCTIAIFQKHNPIFEGFKKASEAYQKRNEKL